MARIESFGTLKRSPARSRGLTLMRGFPESRTTSKVVCSYLSVIADPTGDVVHDSSGDYVGKDREGPGRGPITAVSLG